MRMTLAGHQFPWALAIAFGTSAAHEAAMVQEEPQQMALLHGSAVEPGEIIE